jgi:thiol-disulfide isomerase/thioredoxin
VQNRKTRYLLYALTAFSAFGAGLWLAVSRQAVPPPAVAKADSPAAAIYAMELPDLQGKQQRIAQWRGKVVVVNFWATWCAPCREEIPIFVKMQKENADKGLQFVGISIDQVDKTLEFSKTFGINYPTLIGAFDAVEVSRQAGNDKRVLPFTIVFDRQGRIAATESGGVKQDRLEAIVRPLL